MHEYEQIKFFKAGNEGDFLSVLRLINDGVTLVNLCLDQKREWMKNSLSLGEIGFGCNVTSKINDFDIYEDALFIYYPWRNIIVQSFDKDVFRRLRYLRNLYKITNEEQEMLFSRHIGIVGMSVGMSVLKALVLEGLAGEYTISDFDIIELSNLNRIDSGIFSIGRSKVETAYRFIVEQDPFIKVNLFGEVSQQNINSVVSRSMDVVIDECDSIATKILIRTISSSIGIPVIMHTSDRGMLDIERYDKQDFNSNWTLLQFASLDEIEIKKLSAKIVAEYCDLSGADARSKYSFSEIGKSLTSWPQLGGDVLAGAGNVAYAVRNLLLFNNTKSGRFLLEPKVLIENTENFE